MKLKEFEYEDITLKYTYFSGMQKNDRSMIVVLSNPLERNDTVEFMFNLARFKNASKLFIAASRDYQFGYYLIKDKTFVLRDAVEALIEKYRLKADVEKKNTYLIGFCFASVPVVNIAINQGYKGIITEFIYKGVLSDVWNNSDPLKKAFEDKQKIYHEPYMDYTFQEFKEKCTIYTGFQNVGITTEMFFEHVKQYEPQKFKMTKLFFLAGSKEETWKLFGEETCQKLDELGVNYEITIYDEDYDHFTAIPYFIKFIIETIDSLGIDKA